MLTLGSGVMQPAELQKLRFVKHHIGTKDYRAAHVVCAPASAVGESSAILLQ